MGRYRKKPAVIEAIQWLGTNFNEIQEFTRGSNQKLKVINRRIRIQSLEGAIYADELDYIIKGIKGEFYPCKPDIFVKTYDPIRDDVGIILGPEPTAEEMLAESAQIQQDFEDLYGNS